MQLYQLFLQHPTICTDSRICPLGSLFFALKGDNYNANSFALSAVEKGCAYAIVDEAQYALDDRFILVENVLETLQQLASYHRKQLGTRIIGITGTNGKTTTKELIAAVLSEKFKVLYTQGNLNNHIGVPLTLLQLKPEHQIAVIEMGANHPGEIKTLCEIASPDLGLITNVGKAHLEGFGSFEGVMQTKAELYNYIFENDKEIFINRDNAYLMNMATKAGFGNIYRMHDYSLDPSNHYCYIYGQVMSCSPFLKLKCAIDISDTFLLKTRLIGEYNAENLMAAVAIGDYFGLNKRHIKHGLERYVPRNNRSQLAISDKNKLVIDAYNANPTSMSAAIINFSHIRASKKTLILGDMLELGEQSNAEHQNIINLIKQYRFDNVFLVGKDFGNTRNSYLCFKDVDELNDYLQKKLLKDHYILIKGSRGVKLEKVLASL
ncbi:MAG: UDP-N-acetylmuramoyl-tripeptide--D-alanyl-D-alanine ligase [Paludibacter sp.]|nr:UDP-N-acetylmuramoyl-tripeptide--D-alanyl-D-alanine ligase [Paludibacter sp.]